MRISGFEHGTGAHCGSTSLCNLAGYYGWGYDEPTCFGLASGLGFTYLHLDESPWRAFFGRPAWLERAFFENLAIPHEVREGEDFEAAWRAVRERIDAGDPVVLFVDLYYLDYYETSTHFAPHSLLAVGYDGDRVYLSDSEFDGVQELPLASLRKAWSSRHVVPIEHRYLAVTDPGPRRGFVEAARVAVRGTATYMREPERASRPHGGGEHGVPGIRAFAAELPGWVDLPDPTWTARFAYQNVERRGTGGGAFRRLYADFLATAADEVPGLDPAAGEAMAAIADGWTALGEVLKDASETDDERELCGHLDRAAGAAEALADREDAFFADLREAVSPDAPGDGR